MESNLKVRAFAAYLGSETEYSYTIGDKERITIGILDGVYFSPGLNDYLLKIRQPNGLYSEGNLDEDKLILKPLSEITELHCLELVKMVNFSIDIEDLPHGDPNIFFVETLIRHVDNETINYPVIDYLRSKGYLLPFAGYDLVKESIATLKTK